MVVSLSNENSLFAPLGSVISRGADFGIVTPTMSASEIFSLRCSCTPHDGGSPNLFTSPVVLDFCIKINIPIIFEHNAKLGKLLGR